MKKTKCKVLLYGEFELKNASGKPLVFKSEKEAHDIMNVNFPTLCDYKVLEL